MNAWQKQIDAAQSQTHESIGGVEYERIPYGADFPDGALTCCDCNASKGSYHVIGCGIERCPACRGQAFGCSCYGAAEKTQ